MIFTKQLIFPDKENVSHINRVSYHCCPGENITVYSFKGDKKTTYLSHFYIIDNKQNGRGFLYDEDGKALAEFPLIDGKAHGKGKADNGNGLEDEYFYYGEVFPSHYNSTIVSSNYEDACIQLCADLMNFNKKDLKEKRFPNWILFFKNNAVRKSFRIQKQHTR